MIFKKLNIHSFGKITDKKLSFSNSFNVIYGTNESGKSTISAFIEAMLYSYPARDTERKKYIPWDKDFSSGSLTIEENGEDITIFRKITSTPSRDVLEVVPKKDLSFFPKDRESYRKTVYSMEGKSAYFGTTDEIEQKISNILLSGDENVNASEAIERLEAFRKTIKPKKGSGGKLNEAVNKISLLEEELYLSEREFNLNKAREKELSSLQNELDFATKRRDELLSFAEIITPLSNTEIISLENTISTLPDPSITPPSFKLSPFAYLLYILCPLAFIITALFTSHWFFIPAVLCFLFSIFHYIFEKKRFNKKLLEFFNAFGCATKEDYYKKLEERTILLKKLHVLLERRDLETQKEHSERLHRKIEIDMLNKKMSALVDEILSLKQDLSSTKARSPEEILSDLEYYKELHQSLTKKLSAIDSAIEALNYAREYLSKHLSPKVSQKAMEYINLIAPKKSRNISLKEDLSLSLTDPLPQSISSCSFGFKEELHLCFRIALSEFLYGKDMPLIFDDPFLGSDDFREKGLIDLFSHIAKERQVIIFTNRKNPYYNQIPCNFIDITG